MERKRNISLVVEYDGTNYHGWQCQPNGVTVEETLKGAIERIVDHPIKLYSAGRTDAGVHAFGQVINFITEKGIDLTNLTRGLNSMLPDDIRVGSAMERDLSFHARYSAKSKTYVYTIHNALRHSPFSVRYSWHVPYVLDSALMNKGVKSLVGKRDFASFKGASGMPVPIAGEILKEAHIAKEIAVADALVAVTHFKAHELSGFGGCLKNLGMGCATREGKLVQHSTVSPRVNVETCRGCKLCTSYCPAEAISMVSKKASIDGKKCIGCGECILICPFNAIQVEWNESPDMFQKKMIEYALGALTGKRKKSLFINFVVQVSPACDCYPNTDAPIVRDIGILASDDPVAIDAASCDMVNNEASLPCTCLLYTSEAETVRDY